MPILEKARELAELIANSPELAAVREAEEAMANDDSARAIIDEFQQKETMIRQAYMKGEELTDDQRRELESLQQKMHNHPLIAKYFETQDKFNKILHSVNFIITKAINGEEPDACGPDCGSGCHGCG